MEQRRETLGNQGNETEKSRANRSAITYMAEIC